jgi:hypothetical protein
LNFRNVTFQPHQEVRQIRELSRESRIPVHDKKQQKTDDTRTIRPFFVLSLIAGFVLLAAVVSFSLATGYGSNLVGLKCPAAF